MSLSNWPDWKLIEGENLLQANIYMPGHCGALSEIGQVLDLRNPKQAARYFGNCAGQIVFIDSEPEYDSEGQPITSEMMGYDDERGEVWS